MNLEIIELEVERIAQLFAQARNLKIKVFFGKMGDKNFPRKTRDPRRGYTTHNKTLERYEIHIRLDRNNGTRKGKTPESSRPSILKTPGRENFPFRGSQLIRIREETIQGHLSARAMVSTAKKNKDKYQIIIYAREGENIPFLVAKLQDLGLKCDFRWI
ncbi:3292_t:CDS:2 [Racocetra persica]|uniref:3292_t:CDS:1 n=1 Tax=Racocetra persica TaxID=160502 RepID=A0ACA9LH83_9GLOM|nr:3292_t:CDS:2 [Racocetra persica]